MKWLPEGGGKARLVMPQWVLDLGGLPTLPHLTPPLLTPSILRIRFWQICRRISKYFMLTQVALSVWNLMMYPVRSSGVWMDSRCTPPRIKPLFPSPSHHICSASGKCSHEGTPLIPPFLPQQLKEVKEFTLPSSSADVRISLLMSRIDRVWRRERGK